MSQPSLIEMLAIIIPKMTEDFIFKLSMEDVDFYLTAPQTRAFYTTMTGPPEAQDAELETQLEGWSMAKPDDYEEDDEPESCPHCGCTCAGN